MKQQRRIARPCSYAPLSGVPCSARLGTVFGWECVKGDDKGSVGPGSRVPRPRSTILEPRVLRPGGFSTVADDGPWTRDQGPAGLTHAFQRTVRIGDLMSVPARAHHAEVAQREVVAHRIVRIERAQRGGDVGRHLPAGRRALRQPQALPDPNRVRVERHDQLPAPGPSSSRPDRHRPAESSSAGTD